MTLSLQEQTELADKLSKLLPSDYDQLMKEVRFKRNMNWGGVDVQSFVYRHYLSRKVKKN